MDRLPITAEGKHRMEVELKRLKLEERPAIVKAIEIARAHGDLSENADYQYAKDKQGLIEAHIRDLEDKIARADVIDPKSIKSDLVKFGATVKITDEDGKEKKFQIVGEPEADVTTGKLSVTSPLARAMLNKGAGDEVVVKSPKGQAIYEIVSVDYI